MTFRFFNIDKTAYKVNDFLSWQKIGSLVLSPSFQRRPVWNKSAKSFLLDTVVRGLPIPLIILRERLELDSLEPKREVVDGQQRLRTLIGFLEASALADFKPETDGVTILKTHNHELAGKAFRSFPREVQQRILNYTFSVHVLPSDTDDRDVLQIFARLNSTGTKLNGQELRNASFFGEFKKQAYELAYSNLQRWRDWSVFSENDIARMLEVEEASDAMLLILKGEHGKTQGVLNRVYKDNEQEFRDGPEVKRRFHAVMDQIDNTVGGEIRTTVFSRKPLFHTLFSFYYDIMFGLGSGLDKTSARKLPKHVSDAVLEASNQFRAGSIPDELAKTLRGATADLGSRQRRLRFLQKVMRDVPSK